MREKRKKDEQIYKIVSQTKEWHFKSFIHGKPKLSGDTRNVLVRVELKRENPLNLKIEELFFDEKFDDYPSDKLLAQIMLVAG